MSDSEYVRYVYAVVAHSQKDTQGLQILANTLRAVINMKRWQFYLVLIYIFCQPFENSFSVPPIGYFAEITWDDHPFQRVQYLVHPRVVFL